MSTQGTIDIESTSTPSGQPPQAMPLAVREQAGAVGQALSVGDIIAQVKLIQDVMRSVMTEGEHYGKVPGCGDKKTLLQPGAQKLTMTFRLAPEYNIQEVNLDRGHKEYRIICTLKSIGSGSFVGQGVGCCSSMESKYRYRGGARRCPKCGKEAIIMGKRFKPSDPEPGWLCWTKKEGCGATWPKGAQEIESQSIEKVENENPADTFNTVLKMAKKRAFVDATITATAASDIFTQDVGDDEAPEPSADAPPSQKAPGAAGSQSRAASPPPGRSASPPASQRATQAPAAQPAPAPAPAEPRLATDATRDWMLKEIGGADMQIAAEYFEAVEWLFPGENLATIELRYVPINKEQMRMLKSRIEEYKRGDRAGQAFPPNPNAPFEKGKKPKTEPKKIEVPRDSDCDPNSPNAAWRAFVVPFGKHAGAQLATLDKNVLWGFWFNFKVETEYQGKPRSEEKIAKDTAFRNALDQSALHYDFQAPQEDESK